MYQASFAIDCYSHLPYYSVILLYSLQMKEADISKVMGTWYVPQHSNSRVTRLCFVRSLHSQQALFWGLVQTHSS